MWRPSISNCVWSTLLLAIFVQQTLAQRTPTISYITQEQIKDIGGTVEFDCSVQYAKEYNVLFLKTDSDPVFLSTGSTLVIKDSRFSLRYDPNSSTYKLQIKDIQETDAGTYTCQVVISTVHKVSAEVKLSVRRPPVISDNSTQSVVASEGSEVQMECYASGYPTPTITWRRENNAILPTGEFLHLFVGDYLGLRWVRWLSQLSFGGARSPLLSLPLRSLSLSVLLAPALWSGSSVRPALALGFSWDGWEWGLLTGLDALGSSVSDRDSLRRHLSFSVLFTRLGLAVLVNGV